MPYSENQTLPENTEVTEIDKTMEALPEVLAGKNLWQNNFHEFDVYGHTVKFVEHMKEILQNEGKELDLNLIAAAWLHDIGKPVVAVLKTRDGVQQEREKGKPYHEFTDHEIEGEKMVLAMDPKIFQQLGLNQEKIASLVYCHYLPMKGIKETRKTENWPNFLTRYNDLKKVLNDAENSAERTPVTKREVMLMFLADKLSQGDPEKFATDREELFGIRDALLAENYEDEEKILKDVYNFQKRQAETLKQYMVKE